MDQDKVRLCNLVAPRATRVAQPSSSYLVFSKYHLLEKSSSRRLANGH